MDTQSTISAFQKILVDYSFPSELSYPEDFAVKRYLKKMELPDRDKAKERRQQCWETFIEFDRSLPNNLKLPGNWYKARLLAHEAVKHFKPSSLVVTNGSEFTPTRGRNSVESKLSYSRWDCTPSNVDLFLDLVERERALKVALKKRFARYVAKKGLDLRYVDKALWNTIRKTFPDATKKFIVRQILRVKFLQVSSRVEGSRFSTVRKNNEKDRPINIEALCNVLVQRTIGQGIRECIKNTFGIDLNTCAERHRSLVSDLRKATIDLSNASDSFLIILIEFLFPKWFVNLLMQARSPLILGLDGQYHDIKKISSMGNGFTFELMSLVLTCIGRVHDPEFSVFGDDIIVDATVAGPLMGDLRAAGLVINENKSFVTGQFRESCGANYHGDYGYLRSFDFEYPITIHDCITVYNKAAVLAESLQCFRALRDTLKRCIPLALRGCDGDLVRYRNAPGHIEDADLSVWFMTGVSRKWTPKVDLGKVVPLRNDYQIPESQKLAFFYGFQYKPSLASATLSHLSGRRHWAKYFMYLHNGCISKDVLRDEGVWAKQLFVQIGHVTIRWRALADLSTERKRHCSV